MNEGPNNVLLILSALYGLVIVGGVSVILTALIRVQIGHSTSLREVFGKPDSWS